MTINKLGKARETVEVAPGHLRGHLMPKRLALPVINRMRRCLGGIYQNEEEVLKNYHAAAKEVDNALLVFRPFISEGNELRHPVTFAEIIVEVESIHAICPCGHHCHPSEN